MLSVMHDDECTKLICIRTFTFYILPLVPSRHSNFFVNLYVLLRGGEQRYHGLPSSTMSVGVGGNAN